jgi:predicted nucleic acid-binding protein
MILIDSDVFLIDLRYPRDRRAGQNRAFLDRIGRSGNGATTVINLLEVTGILSFNLNPQQVAEFYTHFPRRYQIRVVPAHDPRQRLSALRVSEVLQEVQTKMAFGDALIAALVRQLSPEVEAFVTWNDQHFRGRLMPPVLTPATFTER